MQNRFVFRCWRGFVLCAVFVASTLPSMANDRRETHLGVNPEDMVSLLAAVGVGETKELAVVGSSGEDFVVPHGKAFVLLDIVISPQVFPPPGNYRLQVLATEPFTTTVTVQSSGQNPASFRVNLTAGMVFRAGSKVRVHLVPAATSVDVHAFGYLVKCGGDHDLKNGHRPNRC